MPTNFILYEGNITLDHIFLGNAKGPPKYFFSLPTKRKPSLNGLLVRLGSLKENIGTFYA